MARKLPIERKLVAYRGSTHSLKYTFVDENDSAIDLDSNYSELQLRIFKPGKEDSPEVDHTKGDGISILNTNELVTKISGDKTKELFGQVLYYELRYTLADGTEDAWFRGRYLINNASSGGEQGSTFDVTYNSTTDEVSISSSSNDAASAANSLAQTEQLKSDVETLKDSIEWKGTYDPNATYQKGNRVGLNGYSYIATQDTTGNAPSGDDTDNAYWDVIAEKGSKGDTGATGPKGDEGDKGWSPSFSVESDGDRRVLQVEDWIGGEGAKPATGDYVGTSGLVSDISNAVDIRGPQGPPDAFINSQIVKPEHVPVYDSFNRADGALGQADSGQDWDNRPNASAVLAPSTSDIVIRDKRIALESDSSDDAGVAVISDDELIFDQNPINPSREQGILMRSMIAGSTRGDGFGVGHILRYVDDNNFIMCRNNGGLDLFITIVSGGTVTDVASASPGGNFRESLPTVLESTIEKNVVGEYTYRANMSRGEEQMSITYTGTEGISSTDLDNANSVGVIMNGRALMESVFAYKVNYRVV